MCSSCSFALACWLFFSLGLSIHIPKEFFYAFLSSLIILTIKDWIFGFFIWLNSRAITRVFLSQYSTSIGSTFGVRSFGRNLVIGTLSISEIVQSRETDTRFIALSYFWTCWNAIPIFSASSPCDIFFVILYSLILRPMKVSRFISCIVLGIVSASAFVQ